MMCPYGGIVSKETPFTVLDSVRELHFGKKKSNPAYRNFSLDANPPLGVTVPCL